MHRTIVSVGINPDLDQMRHAYQGMVHMLNHVSREIASEVPETLEVDLSVIFFPQIGFLISVPINQETGRALYKGEANEAERWDLVFTSPEQQYFKNTRMHDLDESWGDVYASICGEYLARTCYRLMTASRQRNRNYP